MLHVYTFMIIHACKTVEVHIPIHGKFTWKLWMVM